MIVGAISDLDVLGMDLEPLWDVIKKNKQPDLLLFAGDMYEFRSPETYEAIIDFLDLRKWKCPIVAVFGNREFEEDLDDIKKALKDRIIFLEEESTVLNIKNKKVGIVGSKGALDTPTWWMFENIPDIKDIYSEKTKKIEGLLKKLKCDVKILLTHYSPTFKTLEGERKSIYGNLGSQKLEKILKEGNITFAVHGHAHYGAPFAFVDSVPVFNVCFLVNKDIVKIDTENLPKAGLSKFVR
jgi:Icc-related predicted phosphoesterase